MPEPRPAATDRLRSRLGPPAAAARRRASTEVQGAARAAGRRLGLSIEPAPRPLIQHPESELRFGLHEALAHRILRTDGDLFVVQIGAFDGRTGDPIYEYMQRFGWGGILVEPQRRYFEQLSEAYAGRPNVTLRNVAIAEEAGQRPFYRIRDDVPGLPDWVPQLASFDLDTIMLHRWSFEGLEDLVVQEDVECVTLEALLAGVEHVDLLQIDVEGYDAEIVRMFDFDRRLPSIVRFEHVHLSTKDHEATIERLRGYGYRIALETFDTVAYSGRDYELGIGASGRSTANSSE
jgi:FkbM family methyltransferase